MEFPGYFLVVFPIGSSLISVSHVRARGCRHVVTGEDQWNAHFLITVDHKSNTNIDREGVSALLRQVAEDETLGDLHRCESAN